MALVPGVASFSLVRERTTGRALTHLALDRFRLGRIDGLRFWRVLGTGAGSSTGPGADLRRHALFAVWEAEDALDAYVAAQEEMAAAIDEAWHVGLRAAGGHGTWRGVDVLAASGRGELGDGPVAVITRADVHVRAWRRFRAASRAVDGELATTAGLLAVVGIGELPIARLGTFSLWRNVDALHAFRLDRQVHADVVQRTRAESWYGEELFARFRPYRSCGTWDGRDPLATSGTSMP